MDNITPTIDRCLVVGIKMPRMSNEDLELSLDEMSRLLDTAGVEVMEIVQVNRNRVDPKTLIGKGKVTEIAEMIADDNVDLIIFDAELTPSQQNNLQHALDCRVIDRTAVILDIFAQHAHTKEGKIQVELAQLEYLLPRLTGKGVELSRLGGGIGTRGPGETKLEVDRRRIRKRIANLEDDILEISRTRRVQRHKRKGFFAVSLVGYTNAGKSSLLNVLANADAYVEDQLFATLDSTTRRLKDETGREIVITDTVGFIDRLPPQLVAAFSSTLEEVRTADLLLHVIDAGTQDIDRHVRSVENVLDSLGCADKNIIKVFNKIDLIESEKALEIRFKNKEAVFVSTKTGEGIDALMESINQQANAASQIFSLVIPYDRAELIDLIHTQANVLSQEFTGEGIIIIVRGTKALAAKLAPFLTKKQG